jgi:hypothetical protein
MPRISEFYGIVIWIYWKDHNPPHIHATYQEYEILINLTDFPIYAGNFPGRAFGLLMEWISIHHHELLENRELMRKLLPLKNIGPLK